MPTDYDIVHSALHVFAKHDDDLAGIDDDVIDAAARHVVAAINDGPTDRPDHHNLPRYHVDHFAGRHYVDLHHSRHSYDYHCATATCPDIHVHVIPVDEFRACYVERPAEDSGADFARDRAIVTATWHRCATHDGTRITRDQLTRDIVAHVNATRQDTPRDGN